ncbi:hypothetical protein N7524_009979 [Penicillium chrysogenum]|nr:hypothetical protein N7524_009979 [Penicillium chrysogenum]
MQDEIFDGQYCPDFSGIHLGHLNATRALFKSQNDGTDACCTPVLEHHEREASKYEQCPAVKLSETPSVTPGADGWEVRTLPNGQGGENVLQDWAGWRKGKDFVVVNGGICSKEAAKI